MVGRGWGRPAVNDAVGLAARADMAVLSTFARDAVGPVLRAGAAALGHHRGTVTAIVDGWVGFGCWYAAG